MTSASARTLATSLDKLKISHGPQIPLKQTKGVVADSWDQDESSDTETELTSPGALGSAPGPPPPTPASPSFATKSQAFNSQYQSMPPFGMTSSDDRIETTRTAPWRTTEDPDRRPGKTTSTASRLIAAGIGQKAPRRTKEEREYDQAMKLQEKKKRDAAKEEDERKKKEIEQARKSIWDD
jgi:hypothetical protein